MKRISKFLCLLLVLAMIMPMIPAVVRAEEVPGEAETDRIEVPVPEEETDEVLPETEILTAHIPFQINPLYEGLITADDLDIPELPERDPEEVATHASYYYTIEEAAKQIRKYMKKRTETFTINVKAATNDYNGLANEMLAIAMEHTGQPTEGDYLRWQYGGITANITRSYNSTTGMMEYTYDFAVPYYTTAAQEEEMNTTVSRLLSNLGIRYKSDYEKVTAIYDWICENVTYDYDNLEDTSYTLKFSAYAAITNKTAVCQGYALLFYRMMLELGVDARFIGGDGGGPHAWNIVQLGDYYYNLDSTWDAGYTDYEYFLKSTWTFGNHYRDPEFDSWEFHMDHPMAAEDYVHGGTATLDPYINTGYCGTEENGYANAIWVMMRDGTLYIEGEGATLDYKEKELPYWFYWIDHIEKAEISEGITKVGNYALYKASSMKEVSLPESLTEIGKYAFAYSGLESVDIPESAITIGDSAFYQAASLKQAALPAGMTVISGYSFAGTGLETVVIPAGVRMLDSHQFSDCYALKSVTFPEGLVVISNGAFENCDSLTNLSFPSTLTTITSNAFSNCDGLTELTIPETVTRLDGFDYCKNLTKVTLNNAGSVYGFMGCTALTDITFGPNIISIGSEAFSGCKSLKEITIPVQVRGIGLRAFSNCTSLETVYLYNSGSIKEAAFQDCSSLKNVNMTNVSSIENNAFTRCPLESITLPASLKSLSNAVFNQCTALCEITFLGDAPAFSQNTFMTNTATAYYPAGNATWTEEVMQNYNGTITWISYTPACPGHEYEIVVTEPTCQEQGYTTYTCTNCGDSYVDDYTDPVDHAYEDGYCKWCGKGEEYAKFTTISTSLGGNIAMNFYLELSEDLVSDPDAYIQFTFAGRTVNVPLSQGVLSGKTYRYSCPITSKNMTDNITAQVYNADGPVGASKTMDVATYCNWVIDNYTDAKTVNLMKAMLNYGASAQLLFNYRTDDLANAALAESDKVLGKVDASSYIHSRTGEEEGIKPTTYTLLLDSETTVRVYFQLTGNKTIDQYTFTVDGVEVTPVYKDGLYYIQKTDIGAHRLDELHVFTCGNITIRYGGLSYVNQVMTYYTEGTTFDMASALYAYSKAAEAYIG